MIVNFDSIFQNPGQKNIWRNAISKILGYIPKRYITLETITTTVDEGTLDIILDIASCLCFCCLADFI